MKPLGYFILLLMVSASPALSQLSRDSRNHERGLLRQTVYNTGELGRALDKGVAGVLQGYHSMEWPPNSRMILDGFTYDGQHNSFGAGLWIAGTVRPYATNGTTRIYDYCGGLSDNNGAALSPAGVYSVPTAPMDYHRNFPLNVDGTVNISYDPDDAEERITAEWNAPFVAVTPGTTPPDNGCMHVKRTSRSWSWPGYDSFIIYEYELTNQTPDTIKDMTVIFNYAIGCSMFGYQRKYGRWDESLDWRGQNGQGNQFTHLDMKRWLSYSHERDGLPDTVYFDLWSTPGNRGGLDAPQAAGIMTLFYDYDHLALKTNTQLNVTNRGDTLGAWDTNLKMKQPFVLRYESASLNGPDGKVHDWLNTFLTRKTAPASGSADSGRFRSAYVLPGGRVMPNPYYWMGRTKGSVNLSWYQPVNRGYGFAPYTVPPGVTLRFAVAEVVGYGAGIASDTQYVDLGGSIRAAVDAGQYMNPVPSWYDTLMYGGLGARPFIGSTYLKNHPLPWYVTPGVISVRDVADRAIEMYTGQQRVKHDTVQYEPLDMEITQGRGVYNSVPVPIPSPVIDSVVDTRSSFNKVYWKPAVEQFQNLPIVAGRIHARLSHYEAWRAQDPQGPWAKVDSVGIRDPRYFRDSSYVLFDTTSILGSYYYYAILSVDSLGGRSGLITNMATHVTSAPPVPILGKVYVVPNPLIVTNGRSAELDPNGELTDRLQFFGLTKNCTIRVFSYSGQLIQTIVHEGTYNNPFYQISRNGQRLASGVYFFVVEDQSGARAHGKFVIIH